VVAGVVVDVYGDAAQRRHFARQRFQERIVLAAAEVSGLRSRRVDGRTVRVRRLPRTSLEIGGRRRKSGDASGHEQSSGCDSCVLVLLDGTVQRFMRFTKNFGSVVRVTFFPESCGDEVHGGLSDQSYLLACIVKKLTRHQQYNHDDERRSHVGRRCIRE